MKKQIMSNYELLNELCNAIEYNTKKVALGGRLSKADIKREEDAKKEVYNRLKFER